MKARLRVKVLPHKVVGGQSQEVGEEAGAAGESAAESGGLQASEQARRSNQARRTRRLGAGTTWREVGFRRKTGRSPSECGNGISLFTLPRALLSLAHFTYLLQPSGALLAQTSDVKRGGDGEQV